MRQFYDRQNPARFFITPAKTPDRLDLSRNAPHETIMLIYKIFRANEWADLRAQGETPGAPIDVEDGYIHFSTAETVQETAAKYFAGAEGLVLCAVETEGLEPLKWEPAREDVLFPHLYRNIRLTDVLWHKPLPLVAGTHQFPDL